MRLSCASLRKRRVASAALGLPRQQWSAILKSSEQILASNAIFCLSNWLYLPLSPCLSWLRQISGILELVSQKLTA